MRESSPVAGKPGPTEEEDDSDGRWYDVSRVIMFSDAVFAVAITLLILNILPLADFASSPSAQKIVDLLGSSTFLFQLLSYALSFSIIGIYWQRHHWIFRHIIKADSGLLWLNLTLLLFIVFLPFPTNLLGRYGGASVVAALYAGVLVMLSAMQLLLWEYATIRHRLVRPSLEQNTIVYIRMRMLLPVPILAISIGLAFINPYLAEAVWLVMLLVSPLVLRRFRPRRKLASRRDLSA